jgi:hypothetical protein
VWRVLKAQGYEKVKSGNHCVTYRLSHSLLALSTLNSRGDYFPDSENMDARVARGEVVGKD